MDMLIQLEEKVEQLLARLQELQNDNVRLTNELAALQETQASLAQENRNLQESLARNEAVRQETMERIKTLLDKLHTHLPSE